MEKIIAFIISLLSITFGVVGCQGTSNDNNSDVGMDSDYSEFFGQSEEESETELFQSNTTSEMKEEFSSDESEEISECIDDGIVLPDIEF